MGLVWFQSVAPKANQSVAPKANQSVAPKANQSVAPKANQSVATRANILEMKMFGLSKTTWHRALIFGM